MPSLIPPDHDHYDQDGLVSPFPGPRGSVPLVTQFRSTWIVTSLASLRCHGHFDRYRALLRQHEDEILSCVAGTWLPIAVARAHYETCDGLDLSNDELAAMARGDGGAVRRAWYAGLIANMDRAAVTRWTVLSQLQRLWSRGAVGGAVAVFRLGPREARVEYVACELFDIPHFYRATRAVLVVLGEHLDPGVTVHALPQPAPGEAAYRMQWT
jgi:hypothetical protein